jgi:hypothetical protein
MGNELLVECVSHMLDEDPLEEYRKEELSDRFMIN